MSPDAQIQTSEPAEPAEPNAEQISVNELIVDIEGEMHLHLARVQEFMDGTADFAPIQTEAERDRLVKLRTALSDAVCAVSGA